MRENFKPSEEEEDEADAWKHKIENNVTLTTLELGDIKDYFKSVIGNALLTSSNNEIQYVTCSKWSIKAETKSLNLSEKQLHHADVKLLAGVIKFNRSLTSANLGGNNIGDDGAKDLSEALKTNSTLKTLELIDNDIGSAGAQSLADMLKVNRALTTLNLAGCGIGLPDGWSLEHKTHGISDRQYTNHEDSKWLTYRPGNATGTCTGVEALAQALNVNKTLTFVDLTHNDITFEGKNKLRDAVKGNKKIKLKL